MCCTNKPDEVKQSWVLHFFDHCLYLSVPEAAAPSSLPRPVSIRVLNSVPMGSRGWPTQPSRLVTDVTPLWSSSAVTHILLVKYLYSVMLHKSWKSVFKVSLNSVFCFLFLWCLSSGSFKGHKVYYIRVMFYILNNALNVLWALIHNSVKKKKHVMASLENLTSQRRSNRGELTPPMKSLH